MSWLHLAHFYAVHFGAVLRPLLRLAMASVLMKGYGKHEDTVILTGYQFILGGILLIFVSFCAGGTVSLDSALGTGVLCYLALLSAVAFTLWGVLLKYNPVSKVTIYHFTVPVFGVILSKIMLTEQSWVSLVNLMLTLLLICAGIVMLNFKKEERKNGQ